MSNNGTIAQECALLAQINQLHPRTRLPSASALTSAPEDCCSNTAYAATVKCENGRVVGLDLSDSGIAGAIPTPVFSLTALRNLTLSANAIATIPDGISNLTNLFTLNLDRNEISELPAPLLTLPRLVALNLNRNKLTAFPSSGLSRNLTSLRLANNSIAGPFPSQLTEFRSLVVLDLGINSLTGPLPDLSPLQNLTFLYIGSNKLTGSFPANQLKLPKLLALDIGSNLFSGPIPGPGDWPAIKFLYLSLNAWGGVFPGTFGNLKTLEDLQCRRCNFTGIGSGLGNAAALTALALSNNLITTVPEEVFRMKNLQVLRLPGNLIEGRLSETVGNLTALRILDLSNNRFSGPVPQSIANLKNLKEIYLQTNFFAGTLPVSASSSVTTFNITRNCFDASVAYASRSNADCGIRGSITLSPTMTLVATIFGPVLAVVFVTMVVTGLMVMRKRDREARAEGTRGSEEGVRGGAWQKM
ncbi:hypothetical protein HDU96_010495 [Phlyctochytrium bullatum]|nr:hypothetical protein HDU96_010495 [Phlyctochytrium bullatum]